MAEDSLGRRAAARRIRPHALEQARHCHHGRGDLRTRPTAPSAGDVVLRERAKGRDLAVGRTPPRVRVYHAREIQLTRREGERDVHATERTYSLAGKVWRRL